MAHIKIVSFCLNGDLIFIMFYMFNRIGWGFIGFMCLLESISMLANKNVKEGGWALEQLWLFWVAPIVGAIIGAIIYRILGCTCGCKSAK